MDENEKFLERKRKFSSSFLDQEIEQVAPQNKFEQIRNISEQKNQQVQQMFLSVGKMKKIHAVLLVDRPLNTILDKSEEKILSLMTCLRHRLRLPFHSKIGTGKHSVTADDCFEFDALLTSREIGDAGSYPFVSNKEVTSNMYETLLQLINEFDAAGTAEIFRLLLERRIAIPLFLPDSKKHYLSLLRHITLPDGIRLGEDKTLMRVAVISCRQRKESETTEILKNLFHVESVHSHDLSNDCNLSNMSIAEMGNGFVLPSGPGREKGQQVLVLHVIGDFKSLWPFLNHFADCLLIEDSTVEEESFCPTFLKKEEETSTSGSSSDMTLAFPFVCVWKPSLGGTFCKKTELGGFQQFHINGKLAGKTLTMIRKVVNMAMENVETQSQSYSKERLSLYQIPILLDDGFSALECVAPTEIERKIAESAVNLGEIKKNNFLLQKNYKQQAKHEQAKLEQRLNEEKFQEEEAEIKKCKELRRADARDVQKHPLLQLFLNLLADEDSSSRVLSIRVLEKVLAERGKVELEPLLLKVKDMYSSYVEKQSNSPKLSNDEIRKGELKSAQDELDSAKSELIESVLNIEHLWRELSHLYTAMEPASRSATIKNIPRLAAQHLLDGFCLELLDGDSNMIHLDWVNEVLRELKMLVGNLKRERIFVLSVMGVQSSGKSTLLNTMFGVQMRTSVGQCTRGVNMQLLAVEGRSEYDFILLLDTEGTRSPEHHSLPGSEKRDNQMATLSILLADATVVVTPGENDAAIKEILPVVLMAFQGSKLAEENGGRLSSRMFFVYNRIDTSQKDKLNSIVQTLGTSLHESFSQVQKLIGNSAHLKSESSPFRSFNLDTSHASGSDVCILGNVKEKFEPPGDVPDPAFGEALVEFREHIHRRVTHRREDGTIWRSKSIDEFSSYIKEVWKCICSADFTFNFASIVECTTFDKLDFEYKTIERKLAEAYQDSFDSITKLMIKEKGGTIGSTSEWKENEITNESRMSSFEAKLREEMSEIEQSLDCEMKEIVTGKGREKWCLQFQELWKVNKKDQARNWVFSLRTSFITLFNYEHHVESYKKKMRQRINELFKLDMQAGKNDERNQIFEDIFDSILIEARQEFPPKDIPAEIVKVYQNSNLIKKRQIEINPTADLAYCEKHQEKDLSSNSNPSFLWNTKKYFDMLYSKVLGKKCHQNVIDSCLDRIHLIVHGIASGKLRYDDSVVSNVICDVDAAITEHNVSLNSEVHLMHTYGQVLIIDLMQQIEKRWEEENSVFAKLQQRTVKADLHHYFMMVSRGVDKTKLFATTLASALETAVISAFEKEMVKKTSNRIRNERWLQDARFMHKHLDLHLVDLLKKKKISEVLEFLRNPKHLYDVVLGQLIAQKVPKVDEEWATFINHLKQAITNAALATNVVKGRAQTFVGQLRNEFLNGYLQSDHLASAFLIDCTGEYEDCDSEGKMEFQEMCLSSLMQILNVKKSPNNQQDFAKKLSPQVVKNMKALNDPAALPRCGASCRLCGSLCIETADHDTNLRPHDAIHQPAGIAGVNCNKSHTLVSKTCSLSYECDATFILPETGQQFHKYRNFDKVFPGWKNPRINEELPVREYILATHNEDLAKKYKVKPCADIPSSFFRDLATVKEQLKRELLN